MAQGSHENLGVNNVLGIIYELVMAGLDPAITKRPIHYFGASGAGPAGC